MVDTRGVSDERSLLAKFRTNATHPAALSLDDDAAAFADGTVITNDLLIEDVDFRRATFSADDIGHKAMAANLSDLAAMGATPRWYVQSLGAPRGDEAWLEGMASGAHALASQHGCALVGGDLSASPRALIVSITAAGQAQGRVLRRRQASAGDRILCGATLGDAAAGLWLLEHGYTTPSPLVQKQRRPEPQLALGQWLAQTPQVTSAMDISDGLAADLPRLIPQGLGAEVTHLPISVELATFASTHGQSAERFALTGGEEFCLLFTIDPSTPPSVLAAAPVPIFELGVVNRTGTFVCHSSASLSGATLPWPRGFDHFAP